MSFLISASLGSWLISLLMLSTFAVLWSITDSSALRAQFLATPDSSAVRDWFFAPPLFSRMGSAFYTPFNVSVGLQFPVYGFQFCWEGRVQSAQGLHWIIFPG
jgi:hypothetical protein